MNFSRTEQLKKELSLLRSKFLNNHQWQEVAPDIWQIGVNPGEKISLVVSVLIHGNETGGIGVLNELLNIDMKTLALPKNGICIIIGNVNAALQSKRFLDRDLNRSFGRLPDGSWETERALQIAPFLDRAEFYLDIHQTFMPSDRSFFIFPYSRPSIRFARQILPRATVVTHWGKPFSSDGMCTDEFVGTRGGVGLTLELGQNGFDPNQIFAGVNAVIKAIDFARGTITQEPEWIYGPLFTWEQIVPWPTEGEVSLDPDWTNFKPILKGQRMGVLNGADLIAPSNGWMIFPKYFSPEVPQTSRPAEIYRIMKMIGQEDLPGI